MKNDWLSAGGKTYFFNVYGTPIKGLKLIGGRLYGFDQNGVQFKNRSLTSEGKAYSFNAYGVGKGEYRLSSNPYEAQKMGTNPVYYYKHPTLNLALDFRNSPDLARDCYVIPTDKGFNVHLRRATIAYQRRYHLPESQLTKRTMSIGRCEIFIGDANDAYGILNPGPGEGGPGKVKQVNSTTWICQSSAFTGGVDLPPAMDERIPRPSHGANPALIDCVVLSGASVSASSGRSNAWTDYNYIREKIKTEPGLVEWNYGLPLFHPSIVSKYVFRDYDLSSDELEYFENGYRPVYRAVDADVLGGSAKELIIDCSSRSSGAPGYTAVFMITPQGLLLADLQVKSYPGQSFYGL